MPTISVPDYAGGSIVNLMAHIEMQLTGSAASPPLHEHLSRLVNSAKGYVVVVFDGLGSAQLDHQEAGPLARARFADLDTVFPATTTVALASLATGLSPSQHGLLGYQLWLPQTDTVVNTIKWTTLWGAPIAYDTSRLLPSPNLWERLADAGVEPVTVQPAHFDRSPLTRALYRGCRFEPARNGEELVEVTLDVARENRVVITYVPHVDFAAHVHGRQTPEYAAAMKVVAAVWSGLARGLPDTVTLLGTADHGHVDFPRDSQHKLTKADHKNRTFYGDGRAMFVRGDGAPLAAKLPAIWVPGRDARPWWGPGEPHPRFEQRAPDGVLLAEDDALLLHRFSDDRMIGNHGAMTADEQKVPLLVRR